jgi:hypothetical protein
VPLTVVQIAVRLMSEARDEASRQRDENLCFDEAWAVFDVDDHPKIPEAIELASKNGVEVAISNPNFELWALLHFEDCHAATTRIDVVRRLKVHLPNYEKELPYEKLSPSYLDAVSRAANLENESQQHSSPRRNPTTGIYKLTERIRSQQ